LNHVSVVTSQAKSKQQFNVSISPDRKRNEKDQKLQSQLFTLVGENREEFIRLMVHVLVGDLSTAVRFEIAIQVQM